MYKYQPVCQIKQSPRAPPSSGSSGSIPMHQEHGLRGVRAGGHDGRGPGGQHGGDPLAPPPEVPHHDPVRRAPDTSGPRERAGRRYCQA